MQPGLATIALNIYPLRACIASALNELIKTIIDEPAFFFSCDSIRRFASRQMLKTCYNCRLHIKIHTNLVRLKHRRGVRLTLQCKHHQRNLAPSIAT